MKCDVVKTRALYVSIPVQAAKVQDIQTFIPLHSAGVAGFLLN